MPLTSSTPRKLAHTRVVTCHGYARNDGLWDIEGRIVDTKPYRFTNRDRGGWIEADEALHDMSIRLTIDLELKIHATEAVIDASPYNYCKSVTSVADNLVGLTIGPGWSKRSKQAMGANRGCTHLTELLGPIATTAVQTIVSEKIKRSGGKPSKITNAFLNTCYSYADDSPVVKLHWPESYRGNDRD